MARRRFSKDVLALNPELCAPVGRRQAAGVEDVADQLLAELRRWAPDLVPGCVRDYRAGSFLIDLAWPAECVAVEVDGGQHQPGGGKHGGVRDYQKVRALTLCGWTVLRFHAHEVRTDPLNCMQDIYAALGVARAAQEAAHAR